MRKVVTLLQCIKNWCMMYKDDMGRNANQTIIWKIEAVLRVVFL